VSERGWRFPEDPSPASFPLHIVGLETVPPAFSQVGSVPLEPPHFTNPAAGAFCVPTPENGPDFRL
jgi:hypothetical protein